MGIFQRLLRSLSPSTCHGLLLSSSVLWLLLLLTIPRCCASYIAFWATALLIVLNFLYSAWMLYCRSSVAIALNLCQLALFGLLHVQLATAISPRHYTFERPPQAYDWVEFSVAHVLRAADVFDTIDEFGVDAQKIRHRSSLAGILLVAMHLAVDIFLFSLLARRIERFFGQPIENKLREGRKICGWLMLALFCYGACALYQGWPLRDWLLWPLDNVLRIIDLGDAFQVFHWRLHSVSGDPASATLAVLFRLAVGIFVAKVIAVVRVTHLQGLGLTVDELIEELHERDPQTRRGAAEGLRRSGADDDEALQALGESLRQDHDAHVRLAAAQSLAALGAAAQPELPALLYALEEIHGDVRAAAIDALVQLGQGAVPSLTHVVTDHRCSWARRAAAEALVRSGDPVVMPLMVRALRDPHETMRLFAIQTLAALGNSGVVEPLIGVLEDKVAAVREAAAEALRSFQARPATYEATVHQDVVGALQEKASVKA